MNLAHRIEGQSVVVFAILPFWRDSAQRIDGPVAKATYVCTVHRWRIFWQRADLKWHSYHPHPEAVLFEEVLAIVDGDDHRCFWAWGNRRPLSSNRSTIFSFVTGFPACSRFNCPF